MPIGSLATWLQLIAQLEPEVATLVMGLLSKLTGKSAAEVAQMDADPVWQKVAAAAQAELDKTPTV